MGTEFQCDKMRRAMGTDGGDGHTTAWRYLTPLSCTLNNGEDGKLYVTCLSPQWKKKHPNGWIYRSFAQGLTSVFESSSTCLFLTVMANFMGQISEATVPTYLVKHQSRGPWWLRRLSICLSSAYDPRVLESRPTAGSLLSGESASPSPSAPPRLVLSPSQINK